MFVNFFSQIFLPIVVNQPNIFNNFNKLKYQYAINKTNIKKLNIKHITTIIINKKNLKFKYKTSKLKF